MVASPSLESANVAVSADVSALFAKAGLSDDTKPLKNFVIAACDLDKTLYPPNAKTDPNAKAQLMQNIASMERFEQAGGFVFPVTGNSFCNAQPKFDVDGKSLRNVAANPGIFNNGGLIVGQGG